MENRSDSIEMLEQIIGPAFLVKNGIITHTNHSATLRMIETGLSISDLILIGTEEYARFTTGTLCLCLQVAGVKYNATVLTGKEHHIFILESEYSQPELRALALAAQYLREPLSNALSCASNILSSTESTDQAKQLNRNLYQIHRALCNMSDAAKYDMPRVTKTENRDVVGVIDEIFDKAGDLLNRSGHKLQFHSLQKSINCLIDPEKVTRAILNLISNAAKYAPKGSTIQASLQQNGNNLYVAVENDIDQDGSHIYGNMFAQFLREPGLECGLTGIGLGMTIVRNAALSHGGTLLIEQKDNKSIRVCFSIAIRKSPDGMLQSPVLLPVDYAGGYDHALIELSDVLSSDIYE